MAVRVTPRSKLAFGFGLLIVALLCAAFIYAHALATAYGHASGAVHSDVISLLALAFAAIFAISGIASIASGVFDIISRPDTGLIVGVWALVSVIAYGVSAAELLTDSQDCYLRHASNVCDGAPIDPLPASSGVMIDVPRTTDHGIDIAELGRRTATVPSWMNHKSVQHNGRELGVSITPHWELAYVRLTSPVGRIDDDDNRWRLIVRERKEGASPFELQVIGRPSFDLEVSPSEVFIVHSYGRVAQVANLRTRSISTARAATDTGDDIQIGSDARGIAMPDGTTLIEGMYGRFYGLRRGPLPQLTLLRGAHPSLRIFEPRHIEVDGVNERGEYTGTAQVFPPGRGNADIVAGRGVVCVGTGIGACLFPTRDASAKPSLDARLAATFDTRVIAALGIALLHLLTGGLFLRRVIQARTHADAYTAATLKRRAMALGMLSTTLIVVAAWLMLFV